MHSALQISRKIDYALRAVICMADQPPGEVVSFRKIATIEQVPEDFMAKILRQLVREGLVNSTRGARGGYCLARPPEEISFLEVIEAVDGPVMLNLCLGDMSTCDQACSCLMVDVWRQAQEAMLNVFRTTTIASVVKDRATSPIPTNPVDAFLTEASR